VICIPLGAFALLSAASGVALAILALGIITCFRTP